MNNNNINLDVNDLTRPTFQTDLQNTKDYYSQDLLKNISNPEIKEIVFNQIQNPTRFFSNMNTTGLGIYKIGSTYAIPKTIGTNHLKYEGAVDHAVFKFAYKEKNPAADKEGFYSILREAGMSVHLGQDRAIYRNKMIFLESDLVSGGSTNNVPNYTKDVKNRDILTLVPTLNLDTKFGRVAYKPKYKVADRESYFTGAYFKRLGKLPAPLDASNTEERGTVFPGDWKGQATRMALCYKQAVKTQSLIPVGTLNRLRCVDIVTWWPSQIVYKYPSFATAIILYQLMDYCVSGHGGISFLPRLESSSGVGVFLTNGKAPNGGFYSFQGRQTCNLSTVYATAETVHKNSIANIVQQKIQDYNQMVVVTENFLRTKYPAMVTYVAKPKTEFVLERKAADKIRTFYSASQVANIWMQVLQLPFSSMFQVNTSDTVTQDTRQFKIRTMMQGITEVYAFQDDIHLINLIGYTPENFANKMIQGIRSLTNRSYFQNVFSDNLFISYRINDDFYFDSWDGAKMETCHTPEDFQYYFSVFAKPIRFDDVKDRAFLEAMFRTMLINPLVVCLDAVVDMKGLPSGVQGTAQMNTLKMFQVCNALDNFLQFGARYTPVGVSDKLAVEDDPLVQMRNNPQVVMHLSLSVGVELTLENSAIVPEGPFKQLKVDLLGNNIVKAFFLNEEYYVTALEPERIIRAMCFRKTNFGHILNPAVRLAAQAGVALGKCSNMMLSGAWVTYTYEQQALMEAIVVTYYRYLARCHSERLDLQVVSQYAKEEMDCWGTTDQRQLMATSAMVDAASAMRNSHIQGLSSVNRIFVSVAKRSQFNQFLLKQTPLCTSYLDFIYLGHNQAPAIEVIKNLCHVNVEQNVSMEEFNNLYGDDVFPRTEMDEGTFNVMDREKIIKFLKKPVLTTQDVKYKDVSEIVPSLIKGCVDTNCSLLTVGKKSIIVFRPTILFRDIKRAQAVAWEQHLTLVAKQSPVKFGKFRGLNALIMQGLVDSIYQRLAHANIMNQWVRGSYHVNIGPQKNGPTTIMGVHILLNESLPSFIVYDVLKSYASMNAFLPLALRECALNQTFIEGVRMLIHLMQKDEPQEFAFIDTLSKITLILHVTTKHLFNSFFFNSQSKVFSREFQDRKKQNKQAVQDQKNVKIPYTLDQLQQAPGSRPALGTYFESYQIYTQKKGEKPQPQRKQHVNCLISKQSYFYFIAKAVQDYAVQNGTTTIKTADIMHSVEFRNFYKESCANKNFQIEPIVINAGESWVDKCDGTQIIQHLKCIPHKSLTAGDLNEAAMLLSQNTSFPLIQIPNLGANYEMVERAVQEIKTIPQLQVLLLALRSNSYSVVAGLNKIYYNISQKTVQASDNIEVDLDYRGKYLPMLQASMTSFCQISLLKQDPPPGVDANGLFQIELFNIRSLFQSFRLSLNTTVDIDILLEYAQQIFFYMSHQAVQLRMQKNEAYVNFIDQHFQMFYQRFEKSSICQTGDREFALLYLELFALHPRLFLEALDVLQGKILLPQLSVDADIEYQVVMNFFSEVMIECFEGLEEKSVSKLEDTIVKCDYPNCMLFTTSGKDSANLSQLYNGVNFFRQKYPMYKTQKTKLLYLESKAKVIIQKLMTPSKSYLKNMQMYIGYYGLDIETNIEDILSGKKSFFLQSDKDKPYFKYQSFLKDAVYNDVIVCRLRLGVCNTSNWFDLQSALYAQQSTLRESQFNLEFKLPIQIVNDESIDMALRIQKCVIPDYLTKQCDGVTLQIDPDVASVLVQDDE